MGESVKLYTLSEAIIALLMAIVQERNKPYSILYNIWKLFLVQVCKLTSLPFLSAYIAICFKIKTPHKQGTLLSAISFLLRVATTMAQQFLPVVAG